MSGWIIIFGTIRFYHRLIRSLILHSLSPLHVIKLTTAEFYNFSSAFVCRRPYNLSNTTDMAYIYNELLFVAETAVVTPTVELNALAMKMGERPEYINTEARFVPHLPNNVLYRPMPDYFFPHPYRMPVCSPP